jgi:hypothetical protein
VGVEDALAEVEVAVIVYPDQRVASQTLRWLRRLLEMEDIAAAASVVAESMKLTVSVE